MADVKKNSRPPVESVFKMVFDKSAIQSPIRQAGARRLLIRDNKESKKRKQEEIKEVVSEKKLIDPILDESYNRAHLFPIKCNDIWDMYKKSMASYWTPEEINLTDDVNHWKKLGKDEKHFIKHVLAFFAGSDFIVNDNLEEDFVKKIQILELRFLYAYQEMMENIHSETYGILLETLVKDPVEREYLKNAIYTISSVKKKADWAKKWIKNGSIVQRLVAFAIVEGIFFSGSFCAIFWLKQRGIMPGLTFSNELISRDEGMHRDLACIVYQKYVYNKLEKEHIIEMIKDAVIIEKEFICESLPVKLIGMNNELMSTYIEFVADHLTYNLIDTRIYNTKNPFEWMTLISMTSKTNFFEKRVSEYAKQQTINNSLVGEDDIVFDAEF